MNKEIGSAESSRPTKYTGKIDWGDFNCYVSRFFTVGEVTRYDSRRVPLPESAEERHIILMAQELDKIREKWGSAIGVTSWYRPPAINRAVGGVWNSQHIKGLAVDIYTMDGRDSEFEKFLDNLWGGGLGYGIASGRGFTHLDMREGGYKRGAGNIRWNY